MKFTTVSFTNYARRIMASLPGNTCDYHMTLFICVAFWTVFPHGDSGVAGGESASLGGNPGEIAKYSRTWI